MINTLNIGAFIYDTLKGIGDVKTYPIIADNDAQLPFIVYRRNGLIGDKTKDGYHEEKVSVEITVVADTYSKSIDVANKARKALEHRKGNYDDYYVNECYLTNADERYTANNYIQTMTFVLTINNA